LFFLKQKNFKLVLIQGLGFQCSETCKKSRTNSVL
jgi:hypothetical protein